MNNESYNESIRNCHYFTNILKCSYFPRVVPKGPIMRSKMEGRGGEGREGKGRREVISQVVPDDL